MSALAQAEEVEIRVKGQRVLPTWETAVELGVSEVRVRQLVAQGELLPLRWHNLVLFLVEDVRRLRRARAAR